MTSLMNSIHRLMLLQTRNHFRRQRKSSAILSHQFTTTLGKCIDAPAINELQRVARPSRKAKASLTS